MFIIFCLRLLVSVCHWNRAARKMKEKRKKSDHVLTSVGMDTPFFKGKNETVVHHTIRGIRSEPDRVFSEQKKGPVRPKLRHSAFPLSRTGPSLPETTTTLVGSVEMPQEQEQEQEQQKQASNRPLFVAHAAAVDFTDSYQPLTSPSSSR